MKRREELAPGGKRSVRGAGRAKAKGQHGAGFVATRSG